MGIKKRGITRNTPIKPCMIARSSEFDRGQYEFMGVYGQRFSVPAARKAMVRQTQSR